MTDYETELRLRWQKMMPAMRAAVRAAALRNRPLPGAPPLKVGPLPSKGVPPHETSDYQFRYARG